MNSNQVWRFFRLDTGEVLSHSMLLPDAETVALNTPPGCAAVSLLIDHLSQRVHLVVDDFGNAVPVLVDWQPPAPPSTEWETWSWDTGRRRWISQPTLAALKREANQPLLRQLEALDVSVVRPAGEIAEAMALGLAPAPSSLARLQQLNAEKAQIRQQLTTIGGVTSAEQLLTLLASMQGEVSNV